mmetsp:Transcript_22857/g.51789  ORF Transcript_22857/g.51789 Transcript_22857/m.51789 type:complete len:210 (+) Transcript_22857:324-953(+)
MSLILPPVARAPAGAPPQLRAASSPPGWAVGRARRAAARQGSPTASLLLSRQCSPPAGESQQAAVHAASRQGLLVGTAGAPPLSLRQPIPRPPTGRRRGPARESSGHARRACRWLCTAPTAPHALARAAVQRHGATPASCWRAAPCYALRGRAPQACAPPHRHRLRSASCATGRRGDRRWYGHADRRVWVRPRAAAAAPGRRGVRREPF